MSRSPEARRRWGASAEALCALSIWLKGWDILARRLRYGVGSAAGEIDIVAWRAPVLAFIEVKARANAAALDWALSERQRRRIEAAAFIWLETNPPPENAEVRFDVMLLSPTGDIFRLEDAWRVDESPLWS